MTFVFVAFFFFYFSIFALGNYCVTPKLVVSKLRDLKSPGVSPYPTRTHSLGRTGALRKRCFGQAAELPTVD